jgi:hypothetical protein
MHPHNPRQLKHRHLSFAEHGQAVLLKINSSLGNEYAD